MAKKVHKHLFRKLRDSKQSTFAAYGEDTVIQCEKCFEIYTIEDWSYGTRLVKVKQ